MGAVLVDNHLQAKMAIFGKSVCLFLLIDGTLGARRLRGNSQRDQRSLVNTFPFNQDAGDEHHEHHEHHDHEAAAPFSSLQSRDNRQGEADTDVSFPAVAAASADGKRCIDKVEMIEEIEYDDVVQCDHSYDRRCHTTYVTQYESQQEEECEENFRKSCFIEYEQIAFNETAEICRTPLVKDCDVQGPEICRTEYESECWTKQEVHEVEEKCEDETSGYTTNTKCSKWPREVCSVSKKQ